MPSKVWTALGWVLVPDAPPAMGEDRASMDRMAERLIGDGMPASDAVERARACARRHDARVAGQAYQHIKPGESR